MATAAAPCADVWLFLTPATGLSAPRPPRDQPSRRLASATDVAAAVGTGLRANSPPDAVAAAAYRALWSQQNRGQRDFQAYGGDFLMEQHVELLRGFFIAFFAIDNEVLVIATHTVFLPFLAVALISSLRPLRLILCLFSALLLLRDNAGVGWISGRLAGVAGQRAPRDVEPSAGLRPLALPQDEQQGTAASTAGAGARGWKDVSPPRSLMNIVHRALFLPPPLALLYRD